MTMETKKHVVWMGMAAVLIIAFAAAMSSNHDAPAAPPPQERDLFSFIKPLDTITPGQNNGSKTSESMPQVQIAPPHNAIPQEYANKPTPTQIAATEQSVQEMRARGASDDEVYRLRASALSPDAAAQLARRESEESAWQARVNAYIAERNALVGNNIQTTDAQMAMQQLRNARFTPEEQQRLDIYEWSGVPRLVLE
jgi:hypothetical protein